ncbi:MAG: arsenate reductase/protein-tyrosine-phosphatase family protein [Nocardioidaceae bacterium]
MRLLFVCSANICRSAFAEALARHRDADGSLEVGSAGIHGYVDRAMDPPMVDELARRGVDGTYFRSRRLTLAMVDSADLVLTAEAKHRSYLLDERPGAFRRMFTFGQLDRMLDRLPADLHGPDLLAAARDAVRSADAADDVPDPYKRGAEAAAVAAAQLDRIVTRVVDRLAST